MHRHVSPEPVQPQVRRGRAGGRLVALAVAVAAVVSATTAGAITNGIGDAATVGATAERIVRPDEGLFFPIDPLPRCIVFNNFGGLSKQFGSGGHQGVDIGAELGQKVYAVDDGVLYRQWTDLGAAPGLGWGLEVADGTKYRYFHLAAFADGLAVGDGVMRGDLIGYVGDTGNATPGGWHLHFEIRPAPTNDPVDPVPLLAIPRTCTLYPKQG